MFEDKAKQKICPFRSMRLADCQCLGSECIAWEVEQPMSWGDKEPGKVNKPSGFCKLMRLNNGLYY
jgi:hypothetical protein